MFPKTELCLWRDQRDVEQLTIGSVTRLQTALGTRRRYTAWLTCHIDALLFLADKQIYDRVRDAAESDFPLPLELEIRLP